jgi:hypothetical protein
MGCYRDCNEMKHRRKMTEKDATEKKNRSHDSDSIISLALALSLLHIVWLFF